MAMPLRENNSFKASFLLLLSMIVTTSTILSVVIVITDIKSPSPSTPSVAELTKSCLYILEGVLSIAT